MLTKMHIFRPGQDVEISHVEMATDPGYYALKAIIEPLLDGAHMEHVTVLFEGRRGDMFVDEEGQLKGLPRNDAATAIYRAAYLSRQPKADPESMPDIVGTAIVFDRQVWF